MRPAAAIAARNKATVRRLVEEAINGGRLEVIGELYAPGLAASAREWIAPFLASFPDARMEIIELIAEGDTVAGHFTCSATHTGTWLGHPPHRPPLRPHRRGRHLPAPRREDHSRVGTGRHPHPPPAARTEPRPGSLTDAEAGMAGE